MSVGVAGMETVMVVGDLSSFEVPVWSGEHPEKIKRTIEGIDKIEIFMSVDL